MNIFDEQNSETHNITAYKQMKKMSKGIICDDFTPKKKKKNIMIKMTVKYAPSDVTVYNL